MICIDSQIWIYYWDKKAPEHINVTKWIEANLAKETLALSGIIPIEIAHTLYNIPNRKKIDQPEQLDDLVEAVESLLSLQNAEFVDLDQSLVLSALQILEEKRRYGIGGRDCVILASMQRHHVKTLVTHDKNLLKEKSIQRLDPVIDPPLKFDEGEEFDENRWDAMVVKGSGETLKRAGRET
jgi:predicted nucleic acid-binding protein